MLCSCTPPWSTGTVLWQEKVSGTASDAGRTSLALAVCPSHSTQPWDRADGHRAVPMARPARVPGSIPAISRSSRRSPAGTPSPASPGRKRGSGETAAAPRLFCQLPALLLLCPGFAMASNCAREDGNWNYRGAS